jgi:hypothetical protein
LKLSHESGLLVLPDVFKPRGMPGQNLGVEKADQAVAPLDGAA